VRRNRQARDREDPDHAPTGGAELNAAQHPVVKARSVLFVPGDRKRHVVTGAASGIGHAMAERLLAAGAVVTSVDRDSPTAAVSRHAQLDLSDPRSIGAGGAPKPDF
jgi:NADPH:quinone reductase-like Zn-dependent oxidoreductase